MGEFCSRGVEISFFGRLYADWFGWFVTLFFLGSAFEVRCLGSNLFLFFFYFVSIFVSSFFVRPRCGFFGSVLPCSVFFFFKHDSIKRFLQSLNFVKMLRCHSIAAFKTRFQH